MARMSQLSIGTATAQPGDLVYGELPVLDLPTGGREALPVLIAQGREDGPTLWITANIHGPELTGLPIIHRVVTADLAARLRGTVIALPTLNPAGLRTATRAPYYSPTDPNRLWPTRWPSRESAGPPVNPYEQIVERVFGLMAQRGDLAIDLHNAAIRTVPFTIVDRVLYRGSGERTRAEALGTRLAEFARAFGLSAVREAIPETFVDRVLHRSVSGALVNVLRIPALTVELGMTGAVDPATVEAGVTGVYNALCWAGMLPGTPVPVTACQVVDPGFATRRDDGARARAAGILVPALEPGARFAGDQTLATMVDLWGRPLPGSAITAPADGWLIGWSNGLAKYAGQSVASLAIRDDAPLVAVHPDA